MIYSTLCTGHFNSNLTTIAKSVRSFSKNVVLFW
jgi:hypothetical protein